IGKGAFLNCKGLTSVSIPTNISSIEESTFFGCSSLSSISIPTSVISIGEKAFTLCSTLKDVYYGGTKAQWEQINISNDYNDPLLNATIHYSKNSATYEILQHIGTADTEDPTRYIVTGESNEIWIIKAPLEQFQNLYIDGEKLTSGTDYTATAAYDSTKTRSTVITIENVVLASPGGGNHTLAAEFRGEYACTVIDVSQAVLEKLAPGLHTIAAEFLPSANSEVRRVAQNFTIESARTLLEAGVRYVPYSWKPEVAGGPYSVAAGTLPNGMSVDRETGEIAGIPMVPGTWKFTVGNGDTETLYTLVIADNSNTAVQQPNDYEITTPVGTLSGSDFILYAYTDRTMVIDGPYNEFMELYIDGRKLTRDVEYEAHEGSTVLTIYAQTFEKTGKGTHTISAEFRENGDPNGKLKTVSQNYTVSISQPSSNNSSSNKKKPSSSTKPSTNTAPAVPETPEVPEVPAGLRFGDVSAANWFYEDVKWAYEGGIMNGATANAFAPNRDISQATIVTVLARLGQIDLTRFETVSDSTIESGKWYTTAAIWAKQSGILPDYSAFTGEETISRDQMAIMLVKYLRSMGKDTTPPAQSAVFADADMMSQDGNNAFQVLYHYNIFRGVGEGRMDPAGSTTRAQFAALAHRLSDAAAN
ncbi:MAG: leucine-rich repeat protein, partial [Oscillospiraceae bacterium]|nr:leucine-rich repeat protein [Oscillospiraceae bacterium]